MRYIGKQTYSQTDRPRQTDRQTYRVIECNLIVSSMILEIIMVLSLTENKATIQRIAIIWLDVGCCCCCCGCLCECVCVFVCVCVWGGGVSDCLLLFLRGWRGCGGGGLYSHLSSIQDGIYALRKAHMRSTPILRSFPNVALETIPVFVWLTRALFRPFKEDNLALLLSTSLSSRQSMVWCPWLCARR